MNRSNLITSETTDFPFGVSLELMQNLFQDQPPAFLYQDDNDKVFYENKILSGNRCRVFTKLEENAVIHFRQFVPDYSACNVLSHLNWVIPEGIQATSSLVKAEHVQEVKAQMPIDNNFYLPVFFDGTEFKELIVEAEVGLICNAGFAKEASNDIVQVKRLFKFPEFFQTDKQFASTLKIILSPAELLSGNMTPAQIETE